MTNLPPLPALRAFEAAARLGGFARAAAELNVSTSAISHQIRGLEDSLGARLLERSTGVGGVSVTPAGMVLLRASETALQLLAEACADIRKPKRRRKLTVSANAPFSSLWLARRLAEFSMRHAGAAVNAIVQEAEPDFVRHGIDLAIVRVTDATLRPDDDVLLREEVFPVCSPELYDFAVGAVCKCRLLQEEYETSSEIDWRVWASHFDLRPDFESKIVTFASFNQVVGAAIGGGGIALGRAPLINPDLASGRLVRLFPDVGMRASWCFVLRAAPGRRDDPMVRELSAFLRAEAA
ncbi:MAG TPA: LysR family transcriptional regulator [Stellaceae bacterium]|nr:LysR family transcriptional regulator [Stellaceae bacterium]